MLLVLHFELALRPDSYTLLGNLDFILLLVYLNFPILSIASYGGNSHKFTLFTPDGVRLSV